MRSENPQAHVEDMGMRLLQQLLIPTKCMLCDKWLSHSNITIAGIMMLSTTLIYCSYSSKFARIIPAHPSVPIYHTYLLCSCLHRPCKIFANLKGQTLFRWISLCGIMWLYVVVSFKVAKCELPTLTGEGYSCIQLWCFLDPYYPSFFARSTQLAVCLNCDYSGFQIFLIPYAIPRNAQSSV